MSAGITTTAAPATVVAVLRYQITLHELRPADVRPWCHTCSDDTTAEHPLAGACSCRWFEKFILMVYTGRVQFAAKNGKLIQVVALEKITSGPFFTDSKVDKANLFSF
ncbi:hypothetical protein ACFE04_026798 [Oxalis oulophora]